MTDRVAKIIFYAGTLVSLVLFLALTVDTHRQVRALTNADKLDERVVAGKKAWEKYNCNNCHTILGFGGYYGSDMTKVYTRRGSEWIRSVVTDPAKALANSWRKMPMLNVKPDEVDNLIAFLKWVSEIDNNDWPPQDSKRRMPSGVARLAGAVGVSKGAALFNEKGCMACHVIGGAGGTAGPSLDDVGARMDKHKIEEYVENPKSIKSDSLMPDAKVLGLDEDDIEAISDFLAGQKADK
jgi:nitric oxide reductase subunit C